MNREDCDIANKVGGKIYCDDFNLCKDVKQCPLGYDEELGNYFAQCVEEDTDVTAYGYDGDCG